MLVVAHVSASGLKKALDRYNEKQPPSTRVGLNSLKVQSTHFRAQDEKRNPSLLYLPGPSAVLLHSKMYGFSFCC